MAEKKTYSAGTLEVGLLTTADEVSRVFSALNAELRTTQRLVSAITGKSSKISNALGNTKSPSKVGGAFDFLKVAKWSATIYMARRFGRVVAEIAQKGADYTETLNLWETAMGTNITLATEFVNKMNEAYGISEKTLMNAQATFKNMLGGLGNISDQMAYALSEGITQMAVDYASLYNQTFEQAFTKFQAALAGQVRPIRSVSGFDITEQTLFALYQQLGGEKTMRQLNRTEKQLLSILAIFEQMEATNALGDLSKTMPSFANQSRIMAENWQRVMSYAGTLLTHMIAQSNLLTYVNAVLIFIGDTLKAVAESTGAIQHFGDPFETIKDGALSADEALNQLNGKLLDFDKFRALNESNDTNALGLDEKLLQAFANFDSILAGVDNEAQNLAKHFKEISGLFDEDGGFNIDKWERLLTILKSISIVIAGITLVSLMDKFVALGTVITTHAITPLLTLTKTMVINLISGIKSAIPSIKAFTSAFLKSKVAVAGLSLALGFLLGDLLLGTLDEEARQLFGSMMALGGAVMALTIAFFALQGVLTWGTGLPIMMASIGASIAGLKSMLTVDNYANGGMPDKGTIFRAGEAGAEIVYNTPSGQSGVANIKQIEQAMYNALTRASSKNGGKTVVAINGREVFTVVKEEARSNGYAFSKV